MTKRPTVTIDAEYLDHPKLEQVGPFGQLLHLRSICFSRRVETDGQLSHGRAIELARTALRTGPLVEASPGECLDLVAALVTAGLWHETSNGYEIHDYGEHQETRAEIEQRRSKWRRQKRPPDLREDSARIPPKALAVNSRFHSASESVQTAVTDRQLAALSLSDQALEAVTASDAELELDPIGWVTARLADADARTPRAIRSVLDQWGLPTSAVEEAWRALELLKSSGREPFKGEAAYLVGTLRRMGEKATA